MANNVRAILPFMDSDGNVWNPSVSIPGDHPVVKQHPDHFIDADVSELELKERQGALINEAAVAAKQSIDDRLAEMERQRREGWEQELEDAERRRREAYEFAIGHRLVADSRKPPMEANAVHPDVARAWLIAQALDARFARKGDTEDVIPGEIVKGDAA